MKAYYVRVGTKQVGPFKSEAAAKAEAKSLKEDGYTVQVVSRTIKESEFAELWGDPEVEVSLDEDEGEGQEDDLSWLFEDENDDEDEEEEEEGEEGEGDESDADWLEKIFAETDDDDDSEDDKEEEKEPEKEDSEPEGKHPWFNEWGSKKKGKE